MQSRRTPRRLWSLAAAFAVACVAFGVFASRSAREHSWERAEQSLFAQARILEDGFASDIGVAEPQEIQRRVQQLGGATGTRITLIRADGSVLADSDTNPARMDNLATRPEIVESLKRDYGVCRRWSPTMKVNSLFVARALRRGTEPVGWVRVSVVAEEAAEPIRTLEWTLVAGAVTSAFAALGFVIQARRAGAT